MKGLDIKLRLKYRVLFFFLLVSIAAVASLSFGGIRFLEENLLKKDLQTSQALANEIHFAVSQVFEGAKRDLKIISNHPSFSDIDLPINYKRAELHKLILLMGNFEHLAILDLNGKVKVNTGYNYIGGVRHTNFFKKTLETKSLQMSPAYFIPEPKHLVFSFTTPIIDSNSELVAVLYAQLNLNEISSVVAHLLRGKRLCSIIG